MTDKIHAGAMGPYRFFFVNGVDAVVGTHWIDCADDAEAREVASSLRTPICGIEVWDVGRRICKMTAH